MTIKLDSNGNPILATLADYSRQRLEEEMQRELDAIAPGLMPMMGTAIAASLEQESKRIANMIRAQSLDSVEFTITVDKGTR